MKLKVITNDYIVFKKYNLYLKFLNVIDIEYNYYKHFINELNIYKR